MANRIDVHQHIVPPTWSTTLATHGVDSGGWAVPGWSAADAIAMMDRHDIATGVLSVTTPGVHLEPGEDAAARAFARKVNDESAELVADRPDRFGLFASVPLPDVEGSLLEIAHAYDDLGADGVVLMSNTHGRYLGDPEFDEVVFDTTRTAVNMVLGGVMRRYRNIKVILSHGGGFLPYAVYRFAGISTVLPERYDSAEDVLAEFKNFYFDTALTASPTALPSLLEFAAPGHVLYGSDWPFAPESAGEIFTNFLDTEVEQETLTAINCESATKLFPRLSAR